jgi:hypothetical protein
MTAAKRRLVALLVRFDNGLEALEQRAAEAYEMDSAFDAGEFSGPAIERELVRKADRLAQRLGFASCEVAEQIAAHLRLPRVGGGFWGGYWRTA